MDRMRGQNSFSVRGRRKSFSCHRRFYHLSIFLLHFCTSTRFSKCSSSVVNTTGPVHGVRNRLRTLILRRHETTASFGFYYGIPGAIIESFATGQRVGESGAIVDENDVSLSENRYIDQYESIGSDVEKWAEKILNDKEDSNKVIDKDDWTEVFCAKALRAKFNSGNDGTMPLTRQWVKWMKDSRGQYADPDDNQKHPCMKLVATINAPFEIVCRYLSDKERFREYNSLLVDQEDIETLTPHSKICWSQSKKLLFIQPRDFVTYCRHRWLNNGAQLITNQACDHPKVPTNVANTDESSDLNTSGYRAFSLRGATYISRCPDNPQKRTKIIMLSHCNCGRDVPEWAVRTAVGILAPIKPFEIIHRIDVGIRRARKELELAETKSMETGNIAATSETNFEGKRSSKPAGIAQMGYACFWPEGGGLLDSSLNFASPN